MKWRFIVTIDIDPNGKSQFKTLRERIAMAVSSVEGRKFIDIHVMGSPDVYSLADPDDPPIDFA
jgi:hypothetical protein